MKIGFRRGNREEFDVSTFAPRKTEIKFTGNVRRLRLRPGDYVVIEVPDGSPSQLKSLRESVKAAGVFPKNQVLFLGGGARVASVLSREGV